MHCGSRRCRLVAREREGQFGALAGVLVDAGVVHRQRAFRRHRLPVAGGKVALTATAAIVKSGLPPVMTTLQVEWPASTVIPVSVIVPTRWAPPDGLSTVKETCEEEPG